MEREEIKDFIREYITNNLSIRIDFDGEEKQGFDVFIELEGNIIASDYFIIG